MLRFTLNWLIKPLITCRGGAGGVAKAPLLPTELSTFIFLICILMPIVEAIIGGLGSAIGSLFNSSSQEKINDQNIAFQREMYGRQWQNNLDFWNATNAYNSPQSQMKRFQEAGLNPALMYSQGQPGQATVLKSPDTSPPELRSPEWGNALMGGLPLLNAIADLGIKQAQTDNLNAQNTVIVQDAALKAAQTDQTLASTNRSRFDLDFDTEFRDTSAEMRKEALRQTKTNIDLSLNKDARDAVALATSVTEAADRMKTAYENRLSIELGRAKTAAEISSIKQDMSRVRENVKLLKQQGVLNQLEIEMRSKNMSFNDPLWSRMLAPILEKLITKGGDFLSPGRDPRSSNPKPPLNRSLFEKLLFGN